MSESRSVQSFDTRKYERGTNIQVPMFLKDVFSIGQARYLARDKRECLVFSVTAQASPKKPIEIRFAAVPQVLTMPQCREIPAGLSGFALVDRRTVHVNHIERSIPDSIAEQAKKPVFASIDYGRVKIGGAEFWVPTLSIARKASGTADFRAFYDDFHEYKATSTIRPVDDSIIIQPEPH
jgi:hypothetical protein